MSAQTSQNPPFARFRGGFGLSSRTRDTKPRSGNDEDWYIPYNGPYEAPREPVRRPKARDSWGDPVEDDTVLADRELHLRYGGHNDFNERNSSGRPVEEERRGRSRDRTFSVMSGRTTSSGAVDPNRAGLTTNRRSTVSSGNPPPVPSYISLDAMGGVGESPVPHIRNSKDANRISLASIFSFGGLTRKATSSPAMSVDRTPGHKSTRLPRPNTTEKEKTYGRVESPRPRKSSSSDSRRPLGLNNSRIPRQTDKVSLTATNEDDYYNSYYATLINKQDGDKTRHHLHPPYNQPRSPSSSGGSHNSLQQREFTSVSRQNSTSTTSGHPYAYVFPQIQIPEPPRTAPPIPTPHTTQTPGHPPRLTFTTPPQQQGPSSADAVHSAFSPRSAGVKSLKNSTSTPNLRIQVMPGQPMPIDANRDSPAFAFPKGKDRWLSAETWCDALMFPRPRLKLKQEEAEGPFAESSGRIVSPPSTPLGADFGIQQRQREPGVPSRVLAHSRSLVDLNKNRKKAEDLQHPHASTSKDPQTSRAGAQTSRPPRPKSFAQDDLALPTPTPSLAHVLREGELLESQRRAWQIQAMNSFGNKRTRSMSRTRSKSLTQKGRQAKHQHQSSMEYIAARACLGAQPLTPTIAPPKLNMGFSDGNTTTASGRGSHSHSNSLVKTLTKSSKSHSRNHSRNDSWSKSAIKMAKSTVICGYPVADGTSSLDGGNSKAADLEGALKGNETKVIRLADPAHLPVDRGQGMHQNQYQYPAPRHTPSPADSRISDSKVGIALGTPPDEESDYIPNHPYAQGGLSFSNALAPSSMEQPRHVDYAGPHPSINTGVKAPQISEIIARHRLPPHMVLHPYAQPSARDSYLDANGLFGQFRSEDGTPHPSKMWAQLSPGVVREVLPGDLQYSPFTPENDHPSPQDRQSINDIVGLGETLVNAARFGASRQDNGIGSGEGRTTHQQQPAQPSWDQIQEHNNLHLPEFGPSRRNGFQFNVSRPTNLEEAQKPSDSSTNHTHLLSQLEFLYTPPDDRAQSSSPAATSDSSPQQSPRPLGSPNDLESFQDLFYRPNPNISGRTPNEAALPETPSPPNRSSTTWDLNMPNRRTGSSSLTSLARQLNDEFEQMALERLGERSSSQYSQSPTSSYSRATLLRRPTEGSLQFVFEEVSSGTPPNESMSDPIHAFKPSETLPEDVQSSRASSFIEGTVEDDPTTIFRVGRVESASTPPTVSSDHHLSVEQTVFVHNRKERGHGVESPQANERLVSGLQPPTEATRSSYMTTSTTSRISGLSDFPAPPKDDYLTPKHMSMLSSYFDEALSQSESLSEPLPPLPPALLDEHLITFGINQDAKNVADGLSSQDFS